MNPVCSVLLVVEGVKKGVPGMRHPATWNTKRLAAGACSSWSPRC
ncbi:hypothetical protein ACP70R_028768 [Stipagrostis hirtigluma subsp. patula]